MWIQIHLVLMDPDPEAQKHTDLEPEHCLPLTVFVQNVNLETLLNDPLLFSNFLS